MVLVVQSINGQLTRLIQSTKNGRLLSTIGRSEPCSYKVGWRPTAGTLRKRQMPEPLKRDKAPETAGSIDSPGLQPETLASGRAGSFGSSRPTTKFLTRPELRPVWTCKSAQNSFLLPSDLFSVVGNKTVTILDGCVVVMLIELISMDGPDGIRHTAYGVRRPDLSPLTGLCGATPDSCAKLFPLGKTWPWPQNVALGKGKKKATIHSFGHLDHEWTVDSLLLTQVATDAANDPYLLPKRLTCSTR